METTFFFEEKTYTVTELNQNIKNSLEEAYPFITVKGEISNFRHHNQRHMYFDLKDENSKIKVVMFYENNKRVGFPIENGLDVKVTGTVSVYTPRGEYQIIASALRKEGKGDLIEAFERLKRKLASKGYFDERTKKRIPALPEKIGLITSKGGAVIKDILSVLNRRFPNYHILLKNVNVQGLTSSEQVIEAIDDLEEAEVDVIIIARGGGSLEDLWAFNEEKLAEKVHACSVPIISAIGHETDFTICDFVADIRAATPSVSAEIVIINKEEAINRVRQDMKKIRDLSIHKNAGLKKDLRYLLDRKTFKKPLQQLNRFQQTLDLLQVSFHQSCREMLRFRQDQARRLLGRFDKKTILSRTSKERILLSNLRYRVHERAQNTLARKDNGLRLLMEKVDALSPLKVIQRGYAIISDVRNGRLIKSIDDVERGDNMQVMLQDGLLFANVYDKMKKNHKEKH